jgi:hypothetical protein
VVNSPPKTVIRSDQMRLYRTRSDHERSQELGRYGFGNSSKTRRTHMAHRRKRFTSVRNLRAFATTCMLGCLVRRRNAAEPCDEPHQFGGGRWSGDHALSRRQVIECRDEQANPADDPAVGRRSGAARAWHPGGACTSMGHGTEKDWPDSGLRLHQNNR